MTLDINKLKVFVIEDNKGDFLLIEEYLTEKFDKISIQNLQDFQSTKSISLDSESTSIILLDLHLPDASGIELVKLIKENFVNIPIVILTGYGDLQLARNCLSLGIADILLKDELNPELLYKSIIYSIDRNTFINNLEKAKNVYERLFNFTPQPMWIYDNITLKFLNVNNAAILKYGYSKDEFLSMTIKDIRPKEELDLLYEGLTKINNNKSEPYSSTYTHLLKSGEPIFVEVYSSDIEYNSHDARIVLSNDITEQLEYIKTIEQQNEKLKDIAWMQSHVVRAPLSRILGIISILQNDPLQVDQLQLWLEHLQTSTNELDLIVRDIVNKTQTLNLTKENNHPPS